jgi:hypothetical protein
MKFDKGIAKKYRRAIEDAFGVILDKGNLNQRFIANSILESDMIICCFPVSKVHASGISGVTDPKQTNKRILLERMDIKEAFADVFLTFAEETIDTGGKRGCEGTLIHESRHAFDFAHAIASFSNADIEPAKIFNPTVYQLEWEAHKTSAEYMIRIGKDEYLAEGLDLMILGLKNGKYFVDDEGIKRRLQNSYGLNEGNQGAKVTEMVGLKMRL